MAPKFLDLSSFISLLFFSLYCFIICKAHSPLASENSTSPLDFLRTLKGTRKGSRATGVDRLKIYLHNLGYIDYPNSTLTDPTQETGDVFDDTLEQAIKKYQKFFDDTLEQAIKKYQKFYKLNITGTLDPDTISLLSQTRCGNPDIIKSPSFNLNKTHMSPLFVVEGKIWPPDRRHLTFSFPEGIREDAPEQVKNALYMWASVTPFKFKCIPDFLNADIKISFETWNHGDEVPFDGPLGILAHAFIPTDGRVHLDGDENWSARPNSDQTDIQTVALHELGHTLGLAHSPDKFAVMYAYIGRGEVKQLYEDDVLGIRSLYDP